jgi:uncharacterized protein YndB with AHSA1/START domain
MASLDVSAFAMIPVAPEALWDLVCDTSRLPEWVVATEAVTRTDGPARLGSSYEEINPIVGPWKAKTSWAVVEFDAPHRQVHRTSDIPLVREMRVITEIAPLEQASRVTVTLRARSSLGVLGGAFFTALRAQTRRDNARSVQNLAALAAREFGDLPSDGAAMSRSSAEDRGSDPRIGPVREGQR